MLNTELPNLYVNAAFYIMENRTASEVPYYVSTKLNPAISALQVISCLLKKKKKECSETTVKLDHYVNVLAMRNQFHAPPLKN